MKSKTGIWLLLLPLGVGILVSLFLNRSAVSAEFITEDAEHLTQTAHVILITAASLFNIDLLHTPRPVYFPTATPTPDVTPSQSTLTPTVSPRFTVASYLIGGPLTSEGVCIHMREADFWEPGDYAGELEKHIEAQLRVSVDDQPIPSEDIRLTSVGAEFIVRDHTNQIIGSYGGDIDACFGTQDLAAGWHVGIVELATTTGVDYSYRWEFEIG